MNLISIANLLLILGDAADRDFRLNSLGWIFMICSLVGVWALAIFCYKKLLFDSPDD